MIALERAYGGQAQNARDGAKDRIDFSQCKEIVYNIITSNMLVEVPNMIEVKFKIYQDEGYLIASGINYDIFTQGKNWNELMENIIDAIECHFDEPIRGQIKVMTEYQVNLGAEASSG